MALREKKIIIAHPQYFSISKKSHLLQQLLEPYVALPPIKLKRCGELTQQFKRHYGTWLQTKLGLDTKESPATLYLSGSYSLGTMLPTSDVDLLFVHPAARITLQELTEEFLPYLQERLKEKFRFIEIRSTTKTPIVRFFCKEFLFDCLLASVTQESYEKLLHKKKLTLMDFSQFVPSDEASQLALLSSCAAHLLTRMIPKEFRAVWKLFVRYVKFWAKRKNMCSNATGFPSAIAYTLLTVKVMQKVIKAEQQNVTVLDLMHQFFETFAEWNWISEDVTLDPQSDKKQSSTCKMRVYLPTLQSINTCANVTKSTLFILKNEFQKSYLITKELMEQDKLGPTECILRFHNLFQRRKFFAEFDSFIRVSCKFEKADKNNEQQLFFLCSGRTVMYKFMVKTEAKSYFYRAEVYELPLYTQEEASIWLGFSSLLYFWDVQSLEQVHQQWTTTLKKQFATLLSSNFPTLQTEISVHIYDSSHEEILERAHSERLIEQKKRF